MLYQQLTDAGSVDLKLACVVASGDESKLSSEWVAEGTGKMETEAVPCRSRVV